MDNLCKLCNGKHKTGACQEFTKKRDEAMANAIKEAPGFFKKSKERNAMGVLQEYAKFEDQKKDEAMRATKRTGEQYVYNTEFGIEKLSEKEAREQQKVRASVQKIDRELKSTMNLEGGMRPRNFEDKRNLFSQMKQKNPNEYAITIDGIAEMAWGGTARGLKGEEYPDWQEENFWDLLVQLEEEEELNRILEARKTGKFVRRV